MGHTRCGAVTTAVDLAYSKGDVCEVTGCQHLELIVNEIQASVVAQDRDEYLRQDTEGQRRIVDDVARRNVIHSLRLLPDQSVTLSDLIARKRIAIVGALYDVVSGEIDFLMEDAIGLEV
jgi:carbonic anhydrase/SulP family sulfate permease